MKSALMDVKRELVLTRLQRQKVVTIAEVADVMGCVIRTAQRRFKEWNAFRSCNQNGKFYTLPEIPFFDGNGLWRHEGILFSQHGNLKETVINLVNAAPAGLDSPELVNLLGLAANNPIVYQLRDAGCLRIEKIGRRSALFDINEKYYQRQRTRREKRESVGLPKCEDSLMILVEMIKNPGVELNQITRRLRRMDRKVSVASIKRFLDHHGLLKKNRDTI